MIKAKRIEGDISQSQLKGVVLDESMLVGPEAPSQGKQTRTLCKLRSDGSTVLVEGTRYPEPLSDTDMHLLHQRIATLAVFLKLAGQPYFKTLPNCHGCIRYSHRHFGLIYSLPDFADQTREPIPLYPLLPTTRRRDLTPFGMAKLISRNSRPLIVGFGVSRREKQDEVTIDTRDPDSPLRLWQHLDLRGSAHVRFQPKHGIYSLGLVLLGIAMWQDLPSFDGREDLQAYVLNHSAVVAHRMGTTYRDAMMACLEDDFRWDEAGAPREEGRIALVFADEVVARPLTRIKEVY
jgi:hypothetical protein